MRAWALVEVGDIEVIDVFLREDEAMDALADCIRDEPGRRDFLLITEIELDAAGRACPN